MAVFFAGLFAVGAVNEIVGEVCQAGGRFCASVENKCSDIKRKCEHRYWILKRKFADRKLKLKNMRSLYNKR